MKVRQNEWWKSVVNPPGGLTVFSFAGTPHVSHLTVNRLLVTAGIVWDRNPDRYRTVPSKGSVFMTKKLMSLLAALIFAMIAVLPLQAADLGNIHARHDRQQRHFSFRIAHQFQHRLQLRQRQHVGFFTAYAGHCYLAGRIRLPLRVCKAQVSSEYVHGRWSWW